MQTSLDHNLKQAIWVSVCAVAVLWVIQSAGVLFHLPLNMLGVLPLHAERLYGIFTAPLVHGSYEHLFNNTLSLIVLGSALGYGYPRTRWAVLITVWLSSGIGVWLMGRDAVHLGASGVSHGLFFFLFTVSIMRRDARSVALVMIAFFLYGGMVMSIFPRDPDISYEAHFFGAVGGVIAAVWGWRKDPKPVRKRYAWEGKEELDDPLIGDLWKQDRPSSDEHKNYNEK
ncbi:rhomboid family intramembrane serine protease [Alteromonas sp. ASW11-19]|uniref:Rhomboid family intramembrane serine protease n=1 Tax=Alteromonas salexigens TaxID=2982530 RepID=A0ABT2VL57_9ALTE|nr:rhomboid family intramembrane serine protease [Alteromonas salexigens]MCU7554037.1 rhomboid family intramembrane serine protease [Alteromonas salexigens]